MHVSLLIGSLSGGGAQGVAVSLANALAVRGHNVELVVLSLNNECRQKDLATRVEVKELGVERARHAWSPLCEHFKGREIDAVIAFMPELWMLMEVVRWRIRSRFLLVMRSINTLSEVAQHTPSAVRRWLVDPGLRLMLKRADHVIAQSQKMAEDLAVGYGLSAEQMTVIHNPVSPRFLLRTHTPPPSPCPTPYYLFAGRLEPQKGLERMLEAFARYRQRGGDALLVMVGDGRDRTQLEERAHTLGLTAWVRFEGFQSDPLPWYYHARATLLTSYYEGLPNVLIESIATGTPVISFDGASGPSEIVREGVNGFLVSEGNCDAFAAAMLRLEAQPFSSVSVRATGKLYAPEKIVLDYESVLHLFHTRKI
ncbi:glycosyltransferase involved in cell wall biosynthesis [Thioalkalivibrio sp. ALE21]|uniref:glycosyltransferase n=1 Tax=Thioalkalivibrio sp. ALE21 TaxID=1158175 RepID=UPI000D83AB15|nr:glycosyltransferase [Thioalkalivibrio sp. ALE21]PYF99747.1 glycosyltransferase involved in cell wall biosynthesis [Thioalkalivibrio sp. ALE21]